MCEQANQDHLNSSGQVSAQKAPFTCLKDSEKEQKDTKKRFAKSDRSCLWVDYFIKRAGSYNTDEPLSDSEDATEVISMETSCR